MSKFVSYLRVSTAKQGVSGLGLEAQRDAVATYVQRMGGKLVRELQEVESGKRKDRPALIEALRLCRVHGATLIIAKLDRLARNVHFISSLMESKVEFVAVDFPKANRLTIHIMAAVAEHEAEMISARTKAALGAAKARGVQLGRRNTTPEELKAMAAKGTKAGAAARTAKAAEWRQNVLQDVLPVIADLREQAEGAVSLRQVAEELNQRSIPTARGGKWSAVQVLRLQVQL